MVTLKLLWGLPHFQLPPPTIHFSFLHSFLFILPLWSFLLLNAAFSSSLSFHSSHSLEQVYIFLYPSSSFILSYILLYYTFYDQSISYFSPSYFLSLRLSVLVPLILSFFPLSHSFHCYPSSSLPLFPHPIGLLIRKIKSIQLLGHDSNHFPSW